MFTRRDALFLHPSARPLDGADEPGGVYKTRSCRRPAARRLSRALSNACGLWLLRRRFAVFVWLLAMVACVGLCSRPAHAVDIDALIGFGQSTTSGARYRPETWTPLTVYLTGTSARGSGQLQVTVQHSGQTTTYTRRILLRDGTLNDVEGFVLNLRKLDMYGQRIVNDINIQLLADGRKIASKRLALPGPLDPFGYNVLALTRDNSGLNFLAKKKLGLVHRHVNPVSLPNARFNGNNGNNGANGNEDEGFHNGINPNAVLQLLYTDARALPAMSQGYEAIDALALADQPLDSLTDDQTEAIRTYVRQGGLLIVSGGGDLSRLRSRFFADMLPITPRSVSSASRLPELETRYDATLELSTPTALTEGALKPGAQALFGAAGRATPLITARSYGAGRVVFTSFDFVDPTFRGWKAAPALWRDLLRSGNDSISPRDLLEATTSWGNSGQKMVDALAGKQASSAPPISHIAFFLVAYILLLLPINYLILKRLDRREMAWLTIPLLIVGFTATSYVMALGIKGGLLSANRAVIVETNANSDQAAAYGQMTLYSPRRAAYDIALGSDKQNETQTFAMRDALGYEGGGTGKDLTVDSTPGATGVRGALIRLWDKRSFDSPLSVGIGGGIEAHTRALSPKMAETVITNKTPFTLEHCALIADDQWVEIGKLAPGQTTAPLKLRWATRGNVTNIPIQVPPSTQAGSSPARDALNIPTHDKICTALANALTQGVDQNGYNGYGGYGEGGRGYGHSINAFVGWCYDPLMAPRIDGKPAPSGEEINLLVAHLPTPDNAGKAMRGQTSPFTTKPVLKLEDELPPGARKADKG